MPYQKSRHWVKIGGQKLLNFSSNDYLSLSEHPKLKQASKRYAHLYGVGATASRLVCAHSPTFEECEQRLCAFKTCESALVFNNGYAANLGILSALADKQTVVLLDHLCHASLIDGVLLSGARLKRYRHNDLEHLAKLLKQNAPQEKKIVVTESVFSMDGDRAPLNALHSLCEEHDAYLYVDEAHATGVMGPIANGLVADAGLSKSPRLLGMGTFGKALGSYGAYFFGSPVIKDWLINTARSFIFSTALPPSVIGANIAALKLVQENPFWGRELLAKAKTFRSELDARGIPLISGDSQIISVLTGSNENTLACADFLKQKCILGIGIRPPTVPPQQGRIRLSIARSHTVAHLKQLSTILEEYFYS